jgi:transposase
MINNWKRALLDGAADIFDKGQKSRKQNEAQIEDLYRHIGQLKGGGTRFFVEKASL